MNTITGLSISSIKKNKSRSGLIILSICLTTLLLMAIATFGNGMVKTNKANAGDNYGEYYGSYRSITEEQLDAMKLRSEFTDIGILSNFGLVESDKSLSLVYMDDKTENMMKMDKRLADGSYPVSMQDITAQEGFFQAIGVDNPKVGDTITLNYRVDKNSKYAPADFTIAGILEDKRTVQSGGYAAYVSEEYFESVIPKEGRMVDAYFSLDKNLGIRADGAEDSLKDLAKKCGIDTRQVSVNGGYLMWELDPGTEMITACIAVALLVVVLSVVVILNIFQISVVQRIQEYGKIKAIGTTKKQMKQMVFREGMILAALGIPLGLVLGVLLGDGLVYTFNRLADDTGMMAGSFKSGFSPFLVLLIICISLFTVWAAIRRPIHTVTRISPVEAMNYQELTPGSKKKRKNTAIRKGQKSLSVVGLTMANLYANKKRTITTMVTMGLSCVIFIVMANLAGNMDATFDARSNVEYGDIELSLDYDLNDTAYPENNLDEILKDNPLSAELLDKIEKIDGVTEVKTGNILLLKQTGSDSYQTVTVMDRERFEREKSRGTQKGNIDYDDAVQNNSIIYGWSSFLSYYGINLGDEMTGTLSNGSEERELITNVSGAFGRADSDYVITEDTYKSLGLKNPSVSSIWISSEKGKTAAVTEEIRNLTGANSQIDLTTYKDALNTSELGIVMIKTMSYAVSIILAFISFMNMANTLITSIVTRKQEFGVLQAIGMTNKQLNRSLQLEGVLFTLGTVLISFAVGTPLGYLLFRYEKTQGMVGLNIYHFPWPELLLLVVLLVLMQGLISWILSKNVKKESLVDRIRI